MEFWPRKIIVVDSGTCEEPSWFLRIWFPFFYYFVEFSLASICADCVGIQLDPFIGSHKGYLWYHAVLLFSSVYKLSCELDSVFFLLFILCHSAFMVRWKRYPSIAVPLKAPVEGWARTCRSWAKKKWSNANFVKEISILKMIWFYTIKNAKKCIRRWCKMKVKMNLTKLS